MKRAVAILALAVTGVALLASSAGAATSVMAKAQLRGHLQELGEVPTVRYFQTAVAYDKFRTDLGDANVFPPASSLFMSFDKELLVLYTRGNDTGGRCIGTQIAASFSGDTLSATASWQTGTCGAPSTAHYPFILLSVSRTAADGTSWLSSARSVCLSVETQDTSACASLASGSPPPTTPPPTASSSPVPATPTPQATATRSLTPTQTAAAASPTAAASRSPAAATSPPATASDNGSNILLYAMLVAIGFLVLLSLFLSRGGRRR